MQTRAVQILFTLICLVLAAAVQELVPSFGGTKTPALLLFALYTAFQPTRRWILVALTAGAFEDPPPVCGRPVAGGRGHVRRDGDRADP